jgi:hypothetical protein
MPSNHNPFLSGVRDGHSVHVAYGERSRTSHLHTLLTRLQTVLALQLRHTIMHVMLSFIPGTGGLGVASRGDRGRQWRRQAVVAASSG